jgi:hypothetical protein
MREHGWDGCSWVGLGIGTDMGHEREGQDYGYRSQSEEVLDGAGSNLTGQDGDMEAGGPPYS